MAALHAQDSLLHYSDGSLKCKYHRTITPVPANETQKEVTFTFANGTRPLAVSYRQESMLNRLQWLAVPAGDTLQDKLVDVITMKLKPDEKVTWKYLVTAGSEDAPVPVAVEPAALLLMDETLKVSKIKFQ